MDNANDIKARAALDIDAETAGRVAALYDNEESHTLRMQELKERARQHEMEALRLRTARANLLGAALYGLQPGDVLEVTEDTYRGPKTYRVMVTGFQLLGHDARPRVVGTMMLATGKEGTATKVIQPGYDGYSRVVKVDPADAAQPRQKVAPDLTTDQIITQALEAIAAAYGKDRATLSEVLTAHGRFIIHLAEPSRDKPGTWVKPWNRYGRDRTISREQMLAKIEAWNAEAAQRKEEESETELALAEYDRALIKT